MVRTNRNGCSSPVQKRSSSSEYTIFSVSSNIWTNTELCSNVWPWIWSCQKISRISTVLLWGILFVCRQIWWRKLVSISRPISSCWLHRSSNQNWWDFRAKLLFLDFLGSWFWRRNRKNEEAFMFSGSSKMSKEGEWSQKRDETSPSTTKIGTRTLDYCCIYQMANKQ